VIKEKWCSNYNETVIVKSFSDEKENIAELTLLIGQLCPNYLFGSKKQ
jgi:hypothetical protein